ncbi:MBL fold metallo-hydrolase [Fluviicola sp.]|uniref:MBL fold metallo-hydrolase n=1 Tax=Fluviicola sp. TaxID=1917219 RepID=UPI0031D58A82
MKIRKLNWAGIAVTCGDKTVLIDAVENFTPYFQILGAPLTPLIRFSDTLKADYILLTHLHLDHFDKEVIEKCLNPGGKIIAYTKHEKAIAKLNRDYILLDNNETFGENGITFKAVYSLDGIGEEQTAWIVDFNGVKLFHGGDTIWHNQFWRLGKENPHINFAFLPVNGAVVNFQMAGLEYSTVPASLTPEQAFNAAKLLHAEKLVPIHYEKFASPYYQPADTSEAIFNRYSEEIKQPYQLVNDGEYVN